MSGRRRFRSLFGLDPERDVEQELAFHLDMRTRELVERGLTTDEARTLAGRRFGDYECVRRDCVAINERRRQHMRWHTWLSELRQDVVYAGRLTRRAPGFAVAASLSLAIGIGANVALYGLARAVLLNPLPLSDSHRLVSIHVVDSQGPGYTPLSTDNFRDVRDQARDSAAVAAYAAVGLRVPIGAEVRAVNGAAVSGEYFSVVAVAPAAGRLLTPDDDAVVGRAAVAVLGWSFAAQTFGTATNAVGRVIALNGASFDVVGVLPAGFRGTSGLFEPQVYLPLAMYDTVSPGNVWSQGRRWRWLNVVARLDSSATFEGTRAAVSVIGDRLARAYPEFNTGRTLGVLPLVQSYINPQQYGSFVTAGWILAAIGGAVLLIVCANLANLQVARGVGRAREYAVRQALGAGSARLLRQALVEQTLLVAIGGIVGLGAAGLALRWLVANPPPALAQAAVRPGIDTAVVLFTVATSAITLCLFGILPTLQARRTDIRPVMGAGTRSSAGDQRPWIRATLVAAQVALCTVAIAAAMVFLQSLNAAAAIDGGLRVDGITVANVPRGTGTASAPATFHERVSEALEVVPGASAVAVSDHLPLTPAGGNTLSVTSQSAPQGTLGFFAGTAHVSPSFFPALGIAVVAGRGFDASDRADTRAVAVVNASMAAQLWPGLDAIGQRFVTRAAPDTPVEVVGVARDSKYETLGEAPRMFYYRPISQRGGGPGVWAFVRSTDARTVVAADLRQALRQLDATIPAVDPITMREHVSGALWAPTFIAAVLSGFGGVCLFLACAGVYSVLALLVAQRRTEFGVRLALGATPRDVVSLVMTGGLRWVAAGAAVGLLGTWFIHRGAQGLVYGSAGVGPTSVAIVLGIIGIASAVACYVPARRATTLDPARTLREG